MLEGIVSQQLVQRADGKGRVLVCEVLIPTSAIRNLIREDKLHQVYSPMQAGQGEHGMQTMSQSLVDNCKKGLITKDEAINRAIYPEEVKQLMKREGLM